MGIPLDIYTLHRLRGEGADCLHHLLLRVGRPGFNNADQGESDRAEADADARRLALIEQYEAEVLASACGGPHRVETVGELQSRPAGDGLDALDGGCYVDVWVAETRFGHPWVVMGTAESEEEFWREVEGDEDLSGLGARRPVRRQRAYFLAGGAEGDA